MVQGIALKYYTNQLSCLLCKSCLLFVIIVGNIHVYGQKSESGLASYYADRFHRKKTASGEFYDKNAFTAAHRTLAFGTKIKVTRVDNNKSVVVKINDRGPFIKGRILDLSRAAALRLDLIKDGTAMVKYEVIEVSNPTFFEPVKPAETPEIANIPASPSSAAARGIGLFHVDAFRAQNQGFGIQLAAYAKYENIIEAINELQRKRERKTMMHISSTNGKTVFRLIIGPFESRAEAQSHMLKFNKNKRRGIIVDLSKLK